MKLDERIKWSIYGFILGLFFVLVPFLIDVVFGTKTLSELIRGSSVYPIVLTAPFILGTAFYFIGKYRKSVIAEIEAKLLKEEYTRLMSMLNNFHSGIFIIDREYKMGDEYNKAFLNIFGGKSYAGLSVFDTIFFGFSSSMKKELEEFLNLAFNTTTASDEMLNDISPLKRFVYPYIKQDGSIEEKIVSAIVSRIKSPDDPDKIENLLFEVRDITIRERLEKEIEKKTKEFEEKYELMVSLFSTDREIIERFMKDLNSSILEILEMLRSIKINEKNKDIINSTLEKLHSLKGESFSLGFKGISLQAKDFEEYLKSKKDNDIDFEVKLGIISYFEKLQYEKEKLHNTLKEIGTILAGLSSESHKSASKRIENIESYFRTVIEKGKDENLFDITAEKKSEGDNDYISIDLLKKELELITKKTAEENQKEVSLIFESNVDKIPESKYKPLKEVFLHLIRNSIAHGIEMPDERKKLNKKQAGGITVKIDEAEDGGYSIIYSDDGTGLAPNKIKAKAVEQGLISQQESETMNNNDIIRLIFKEGFSTSENKDMVSGVGIGMSAIKNNIIKNLKGKFRITNYIGKGIKFNIVIPK